MRHSLRTFLLCLLFVTLPIQSIAGVTRYQCGMAHHALAVDTARSLAHEEHGIGADLSGKKTHADAATAAAKATDPDGACANMGGHKSPSCGKCSGCCIGSYAPPPFIAITAAQEPAETLRSPSVSSFTGQFPARLERPPRASSSPLS